MAGGESEMIPRAVRPRDPARTEKAAAVSRSTRCFVGSASPSSTSLEGLTVRMLLTSMLTSLELREEIPPTRPLDLRLFILRILLCLNHPWSHNQLLNLGKTLVHIRHTRVLGTVTARGLGDLD